MKRSWSISESSCRDCGGAIVWCKQVADDRWVPVEPDSIDELELEWLEPSLDRRVAEPVFDESLGHEKHFGFCEGRSRRPGSGLGHPWRSGSRR